MVQIHNWEQKNHLIRVDQSISQVIRTPKRLCWVWNSTKVDALAAVNLDVYLHVKGDVYYTADFSPKNRPWSKSGSFPLGRFHQPYCTPIPEGLPAGEQISVEQTVYYQGTWGQLSLSIPSVVWTAGMPETSDDLLGWPIPEVEQDTPTGN